MSEKPKELISIGEVVIPFYEDTLLIQLGEDGEIYVALRPIVEALGLDWSAQYRRVGRDPVLSEEVKMISVAVTATDMQTSFNTRSRWMRRYCADQSTPSRSHNGRTGT